MNNRAGPRSPISNDGSEGSAYPPYRGRGQEAPPYSPSIASNRGHLVTPPMSGSSHGATLSTSMNRRPGEPSPPNSVARSSYGTNYSSSENQRRQAARMEEKLLQHYHILRRFLAQTLHDEKTNSKPNRARDKLLRLSSIQFQELSTDVYDELQRRQSASGQHAGPGQVPAYLLPRENFHPKRNQARQKLATLPPSRFRDLATDVFYELERRFPQFTGREIQRQGSPFGQGPPRAGTPNGLRPPGPGGPPPRNASLGGQVMAGLGIPGIGSEDDPGRPTAKTFQSNTMIPNKSTMVEDDDEDGMSDVYAGRRDTTYTSRSGAGKGIPEYENQINELQEKVRGLEDQMYGKDAEIKELKETHERRESASGEEREQWDGLRSDLETKLRSARELNSRIQSDLDRLHDDKSRSEQELQSQLAALTTRASGDGEWKSRYEVLDKTHREMRSELLRQEKITAEVRNEASGFLDELKNLSQHTDQAIRREEDLVRKVHQLESETDEWKNRYAKAKTQSRSVRTGSVSLPGSDNQHLSHEAGFRDPDGAIKDLLVTRFQVSVDELLHTARSGDPRSVLAKVKAVVTAVRNITVDAGQGRSLSAEQSEKLFKLKSTSTATTNNLITAAKNFAVSEGVLPVSLLDAAASHLSVSIVALLQLVKIRPTPSSELDHEDDANSIIADSPADYYGMSQPRLDVRDDSVYSLPPDAPFGRTGGVSSSNPSSTNGTTNGIGSLAKSLQSDNSKIDALKNFLDTRTTSLLTGIQTLVSSIRASAPPPDILDTIVAITSTTSQIINQAYASVPQGSTAETIVGRLADDVDKMEQKGRDGEAVENEKDWNIYVKGLPPLAFEIAREVKELGAWVDAETEGADFS